MGYDNSLEFQVLSNTAGTFLNVFGDCIILGLLLSLRMTAFWDIAPCSLVEADRRFTGAYATLLDSISLLVHFGEEHIFK
jgi:hypothetical protein